jgi:hypothetical protein
MGRNQEGLSSRASQVNYLHHRRRNRRRRSNRRAIAPIAAREDHPQVDRTCARRTATIAIIRRSRNVKLFELHDVWRAEEIAIDDGITPVAQFFDPKSSPSSRALFVTQSLDALRPK